MAEGAALAPAPLFGPAASHWPLYQAFPTRHELLAHHGAADLVTATPDAW